MGRRIAGRSTRKFGGIPYTYCWSCTSQAEALEYRKRLLSSSHRGTQVEILEDGKKGQWHIFVDRALEDRRAGQPVIDREPGR